MPSTDGKHGKWLFGIGIAALLGTAGIAGWKSRPRQPVIATVQTLAAQTTAAETTVTTTTRTALHTTTQAPASTLPTQASATAQTTRLVLPQRYDLNCVTREELLTLPQMTEGIADGVLQLRANIHTFSHLYELLYVDGITGAYLQTVLAEYLYVVGATDDA